MLCSLRRCGDGTEETRKSKEKKGEGEGERKRKRKGEGEEESCCVYEPARGYQQQQGSMDSGV